MVVIPPPITQLIPQTPTPEYVSIGITIASIAIAILIFLFQRRSDLQDKLTELENDARLSVITAIYTKSNYQIHLTNIVHDMSGIFENTIKISKINSYVGVASILTYFSLILSVIGLLEQDSHFENYVTGIFLVDVIFITILIAGIAFYSRRF